MTRFLFIRLRGGDTMYHHLSRKQCNVHCLTLFACCLLLTLRLTAQPSIPCTEPSYSFEGTPEPTLCELYGNQDFTLQIGIGTPYLYSSQLPSPLPSHNIEVVGDFIVNNSPYEFNSVLMKINPNVAISVQGTSNSLWLTNCRLFCCDGLWSGIMVEADNGSVSVTSSTVIEDAITAIQNDPKAKRVVLDIAQAVFNRNITGIYLEGLTAYAASENPRIARLVETSFTTTSPLALNAIPQYGIQTKNVLLPLSQFQVMNDNNTFTRLRYGIYAEGSQTRLFVFNHHYTGMGRTGIFFTGGNLLDVRHSIFTNCRYSISTFDTEDLNCYFNTFIFNLNGSYDRALLRVRQPKASHFLDVENCTFTIEGNNQTGYLTAFDVHTNPAVPTLIQAHINTFNLRNNSDAGNSPLLKPSTGIKITGDLIAGSDLDIEQGNVFNVNLNFPFFNIGMEISGGANRNGLHFINNDFNCSGLGIRLDGSVIGTGNQILENRFNTLPSNPGQAAEIAGFEGLVVCANTVYPNSLETNYLFRGQSMSTDFRGNSTGSGDFLIVAGAIIGQQMDNDNEWVPLTDANGTVVYRPYLLNDNTIPQVVQASLFIVTEPQSVYDQNTNTYTLLSLTHPDQVVPDVFPLEDAFFDQGSSDTDPDCVVQVNALTPADAGDVAIAQGTFGSLFAQPAVGWDTEQYLYRKLNFYSAYVGAHSAFPAFLSSRANTSVGKFYNLEQKVQEAFTMPANLKSQADALQAGIIALEADIAALPLEQVPSAAYFALLQAQKEKIEALAALTAQFAAYTAPKLAEAWDQLPGIVTANAHEWNKKRVYEIFIGSQLYQSGAYISAQIADLKAIGQQCMEAGGKAVLMARGLLGECDYLDIRDIVRECYPPSEERSQRNISGQTAKMQVAVLPNPAADFLILRAAASGTVKICTTEGKTVQNGTFLPGDNYLPLNFRSGLYFFHCQFEDGTTAVRRVVIQH